MRRSIGEKMFAISNMLFICLLIAVFFIPYWIIFISSFTDELSLLKNGYQLMPSKLSLLSYAYIFGNNTIILRSVANSVFITLVGTILALFFTSMFAYPLSRKYLPGKRGIMIYVLITILFSGGMIPYYLVVRGVGLYNSLWAIILPSMISAWNMILIRSFFMTIPDSVEESAWLDGANDLIIFFRIMLPLSKPILATVTLFYAVGYWNDWFLPLLFIKDRELYPIQLLIRGLLSNFTQIMAQSGVVTQGNEIAPQESVKMASIIVASLPIVVVYPFLQKYFIKGIMLGSVKG